MTPTARPTSSTPASLLAVPSRPKQPETPKATAIDEQHVLPHPCPCRGAPHDRHRDLRPRLPAEAPAHARSSTNQRSTPHDAVTTDRPQLRHLPYPRWLATGHDQARIRAAQLAAYVMVPQIRVMQRDDHARSPPMVDHPRSAPNQPPQPLLSNLFKPSPAAKSP